MNLLNMDMESRCRLCGRKERQDTEKFKNIFDGEPGLSLDSKINKLLPIVVLQWDPLPHQICDSCLEKLNSMDKFYEDTGNTNIFLKGLLPKNRQNRDFKKSDPMLKIPDLNHTYGNYLIRVLKKNSPNDEISSSTNDLITDNLTPSDTEENISSPVSESETEPVVIDLEEEEKNKILIEKKLDNFIPTQINNDPPTFVYMCRKCYKILTAKHAAISHVCEAESPNERLEDEEKERIKVKIPLTTCCEGYHVCIICKKSFTRKSALSTHLRQQHHWRESAHDADFEGGDEGEERHHIKSKKRKHKRERKDKKLKRRKSKENGCEQSNGVSEEKDGEKGIENNNITNIADKEISKERSLSRPVSNSTIEEESNSLTPVFKDMIICTICHEAFLSQKLLNDHQKTHNMKTDKEAAIESQKSPATNQTMGIEKTPIKETCIVCDKVFYDSISFNEHHKRHMRMSEELRPIHSNQFKLPERKKKESMEHMDVEYGVKKIDGNLNGNSSNVTSEEFYICKTCNATFNRRTSFNAHEMSHITDRSIYDFGDDDDQSNFKKKRKSSIDGHR